MGHLHFVLPALNLTILDVAILIWILVGLSLEIFLQLFMCWYPLQKKIISEADICHLWQGLNLSQHHISNYINGFRYKTKMVTDSYYEEYLSI